MTAIEIKRFAARDRDWLIDAHRIGYARDEGFDDSFGDLVAQIIDGFIAGHDRDCEAGWIAWRGDQRLGSIFCVRLDAQTAKLRLFLLEEAARGQGLGRRMLEHNMQFARDAGYTRMQLWTHESHRAACALYAATGWRMVESEPVTAFGKPNVSQTWTIDL